MGKYKIRKCICIATIGLVFLSLIFYYFDEKKITNEYHPALHVAKSLTTSKPVTKSLSEVNPVTPTLDGHVLFFNRVPKTGSEMFVLLMQWLQPTNGFRHIRLPGGKVRRLNRAKQADVVDEVIEKLRSEALPLSFDRHVYFINFTSHGQQSPTYVNLVRDPVQKVISRFYYRRAIGNPKNPPSNSARVERRSRRGTEAAEDFERCVLNEEPECTFRTGYLYDLTIPYFCGHNKWCMSLNDEWALMEAKFNVEKYYPVVGVLEELNATLTVLEKKIPFFFKGVKEMYFRELAEPHFNKNKNRPTQISSSLQKQIAESLKLEYEFYYWLRRRLLKQFKHYSQYLT